MSIKQLDFSKPNLVVDLAEVKRMFAMHFNALCQEDCVNSIWGISCG